jgi:hypothetical protein
MTSQVHGNFYTMKKLINFGLFSRKINYIISLNDTNIPKIMIIIIHNWG